MSNFDNGGLGDGGIQKSKEKQRIHKDGTPVRDYKQLTYEELKAKIEDALYNPQPLTSSEEQEAEESWKKFELAHPLTDAPEGWEERRQAELMETIEPGMYDISVPGMSLWTGKGGYIDYLIAMEKSAKHYK